PVARGRRVQEGGRHHERAASGADAGRATVQREGAAGADHAARYADLVGGGEVDRPRRAADRAADADAAEHGTRTDEGHGMRPGSGNRGPGIHLDANLRRGTHGATPLARDVDVAARRANLRPGAGDPDAVVRDGTRAIAEVARPLDRDRAAAA